MPQAVCLKGKVTRCALTRHSGSTDFYYVETVHRESLYDFAEAFADYGFIDAMLLTGVNDGNTFYRSVDEGVHDSLRYHEGARNLLIFYQ